MFFRCFHGNEEIALTKIFRPVLTPKQACIYRFTRLSNSITQMNVSSRQSVAVCECNASAPTAVSAAAATATAAAGWPNNDRTLRNINIIDIRVSFCDGRAGVRGESTRDGLAYWMIAGVQLGKCNTWWIKQSRLVQSLRWSIGWTLRASDLHCK